MKLLSRALNYMVILDHNEVSEYIILWEVCLMGSKSWKRSILTKHTWCANSGKKNTSKNLCETVNLQIWHLKSRQILNIEMEKPSIISQGRKYNRRHTLLAVLIILKKSSQEKITYNMTDINISEALWNKDLNRTDFKGWIVLKSIRRRHSNWKCGTQAAEKRLWKKMIKQN